MNIKMIRDTIARLNWNRHDATGGTREENRRTELPALLAPHIAAVAALEIPARFARDIHDREWALEMADRAIARWQANAGILPFAPAEPAAVNVAPVAAIPEHDGLLTALGGVRAVLACFTRVPAPDDPVWAQVPGALEIARAAIAKATGGAQ